MMIKTRLIRLYIVFTIILLGTTGILFYTTFKKVLISELKSILKQDHNYIQTYINNTLTCSVECYLMGLGDKIKQDISASDYSYEFLLNIVKNIRFKDNGYGTILDDDGNYIYHPDKKLIGKNHDLLDWALFEDNAFKSYTYNDKYIYFYKIEVKELEVSIVIECDVSEFANDLNLNRLKQYIKDVTEDTGVEIHIITDDFKFVIAPLRHKKVSIIDTMPLFNIEDNLFMEEQSIYNLDFKLGYFSKDNLYNWTIAVSGNSRKMLKNRTVLKKIFLTTIQPTVLIFLLFVIVFLKHLYELKLKAQNLEIINTQKELLFKLGETVETRSRETSAHVKRVASISKFIASKYGIKKVYREIIKSAAPLHDIGKIGIKDSILNNPGKLTADEYNQMKEHTIIGYNILKGSDKPLLKHAAIIALEHHEYWNGKGYPHGKKGNEIDLFARIVHVADVIDALLSKRSYKEAWKPDRVFEYLYNERGEMFDPDLVDIVLNNRERILRLLKEEIPSYVY